MRDLRFANLITLRFESAAHRVHLGRISCDLVGVVFRLEVFGTGIEGRLERVVLRVFRRVEVELSLPLEHP